MFSSLQEINDFFFVFMYEKKLDKWLKLLTEIEFIEFRTAIALHIHSPEDNQFIALVVIAILFRAKNVAPAGSRKLIVNGHRHPGQRGDVKQVEVVQSYVLDLACEHLVIPASMNHEILSNKACSVRMPWARRLASTYCLHLDYSVADCCSWLIFWFLSFVCGGISC